MPLAKGGGMEIYMKNVKTRRFGAFLVAAFLMISTIFGDTHIVMAATNGNAGETEQEWFTNGGFESGDTTPGSVSWGNSQASVTTDNVHSGTYALQVSGEKGAWEVKIDNLTPNTEYTITVWAKAGESAAGAVGVKEFDSAVTTDNVVYQMGTEYQEYTLTFTTGSNDTRATFFVNNRSLELKGAAGTIYADDISMKYIANEQENDNKPQNPANEVLNESPEWLPMTDPDNAREWKLSVTMSDEFNAAELDTSKWENPHGAWSGRSPSWFEPTNVRMEDGNLVLRSCMVDDDYSSPTLDKLGAAYHTYAAAAVRSKQLTGYGYYEIRCKTAPISMTSSFWFRNADKIKEIDVFEQIGRPKKGSLNKNGKDYPINTHNGSGENDHTTPFTYTADVDLTADFHVYGFEWDEYFLRFYFDGKLIHEISNEDTDVYSVEQNAIFDMETFAWAGYPEKEDFYVDENGYFTGDFYVDYFRVWRSDVPQSNESSGLNAVPEPKEAVAVYGSPVVEEDSTAVDECWDDAYELGELHFKNPSDTDISAVVKTMWDENYLYVMADVSDSDLYNNPTTEANHQSDSFEVYVDLLNEKAKEGYDSNDFKVNTTFFGRYEKTSNAPEGVVHNAFVKDGGYIAQFKIPWMAVEPEADTIIGFDVQVNEATSAENGRAGYLGWNDSLDTVWKTMLTSGNLKLAAKEETEEPDTGGETEQEWFTNGGFESGDTTPGSVSWGNSQASVTTDNVHSGTYALQVSGEKGAWEVKIDNLTPNTEYTITVWAKAGESAAGAVGVKEFDSAVTTDNVVYQMGTEYQEYTLTFTTGSNDTRATFFVNNRSLELKGAAGTIYADDISMKYIASDPDTGGETEDPNTGGETEEPDTGGETEDPDNGGETEEPGNGGETEEPGNGGETEEPGNGGETEEPGNGGETEQADNGQNNTPDTQNVVAPSTGDNNHMELWLVLMVVACSLMGFSICLLKRKR